jgi:hypothetical protein
VSLHVSRRATVIALAVSAALIIGGLWLRASWVADHLLRVDAARAIAEKSGDVYELEVGRVRFHVLQRRAEVDSVHLTTNDAVNARRSRPRTALRVELHQCTVTGIRLIPLILGRGFVAETFGCAAVSADASVPPPRVEPDTTTPPRPTQQAFFVLQQGLKLPRSAPRVQVTRIEFPHVVLDVRIKRRRGDEARLELAHLQWRMADLEIDPADSAVMSRPLFSRTVQIQAENFEAHSDSATAVKVGGAIASLTDSTIDLRGIAYAPTVSDSAFARARPYRRSLIRTSAAGIGVQGLDVGAFVLGLGVHARRVQVDSFRVNILSDKRRPPNPRRPRRRTPQAWIADLGRAVSVDSVLVHHGEIVYREQRPRQRQPGVMTFARLEAVAVNVRHAVGRRRSDNPTTLRATTYLQNAGRLDAQFTMPLDAPRFDMTFRGRLGPMPASDLNEFVDRAFPFRLSKGRIKDIEFDATVRNGVADGGVTPLYNDLALEVTGHGSKGILGTGGVVGDAARGIATFVGNATEMRSDNPEDGEQSPRRGTIRHVFTPSETLPAFLWFSLRDGLFGVVRK